MVPNEQGSDGPMVVVTSTNPLWARMLDYGPLLLERIGPVFQQMETFMADYGLAISFKIFPIVIESVYEDLGPYCAKKSAGLS